jgi:hypothetical protein
VFADPQSSVQTGECEKENAAPNLTRKISDENVPFMRRLGSDLSNENHHAGACPETTAEILREFSTRFTQAWEYRVVILIREIGTQSAHEWYVFV